MIKSFAFLFAFLFLYGCLSGHVGAGLIALCMVPFMLYGERELNKRDAEFEASPQAARLPADTTQDLQQHECECIASRL